MGGERGSRYLLYQDTVGALSYDDYKGANRQYVEQDKLVIEIMLPMAEEKEKDGTDKHWERSGESNNDEGSREHA